ncbi:MAG: ABC transporter permease [Chloroflexota bacterium]
MKRALFAVSLRMGLYTNLVWAAALSVYAAAIAALYPSIARTEGLAEYFGNLPEQLRELAGVEDIELLLDEAGFFTFEGFLATEYMAWWPVFLGVYAVISGGGLVAREAERGTLEVMLSHPISRSGFLITKALAQLLVFALLTVVSTAAVLASGAFLDSPPDAWHTVLAHLAGFGLVAAIFSYSVLFSALLMRPGRAMGAAGVLSLILYLLDVLAPTLGSLEWLRNLSLFSYFDGLSLLRSGDINVAGIAIFAIVTAAALAGAARAFEERDIVA